MTHLAWVLLAFEAIGAASCFSTLLFIEGAPGTPLGWAVMVGKSLAWLPVCVGGIYEFFREDGRSDDDDENEEENGSL